MARHHIVTMLPPAWGHTVSYMHLALQLLRADTSLVITIMQHNLVVSQMEKELSGCSYDVARLRILGVGNKDIPFSPTMTQVAFKELAEGWVGALPQFSLGSEEWPRPHTVHLDFGGGGLVIDATKQTLPGCKTLMWFCCAAVSMIAHFNEYDFTALADGLYADEEKRDGRTFEDILQQVTLAWNGSDRCTGKIVHNPGAPDMYDYERLAYAAGPPDGISLILAPAQRLSKLVDGYIIASGVYFEPVGVPHCRAFYKERGQELFTVGLQTHESAFDQIVRLPVANEVVKSFLDDSVNKFGPKSVLYISFGSLFFPTAMPGHIEALITTLLELEQPFPFIFALGSKMASLPVSLIERVNASGRGLVCSFWVEQQAILQHGGVGWFLSHGGFNSVTESLTQGIPMILWPAGAEQPVNAAFLSTRPDPVAIELFQVRTGAQLGPSLRHGSKLKITGTVEDAKEEFKEAFTAARGARGAALQANALKMSRAIRDARVGECATEILRLSKF